MIEANGKEYVDLGPGRGRLLRSEAEAGSFECAHCGKRIELFGSIGTRNRNHCPYCLFSKHVDSALPGDRASGCQGFMSPIGLAFKKEREDKFGNARRGGIMIIHECGSCGAFSVNRIAGDDDPASIMEALRRSVALSGNRLESLRQAEVEPLSEKDRGEVMKQLFGTFSGPLSDIDKKGSG